MAGPEKICGGAEYNAELGQCIASETSPFSVTSDVRASVAHNTLAQEPLPETAVRATVYGNTDSFRFSGHVQGDHIVGTDYTSDRGPVDAQLCWEPEESSSVCGQYSSIPLPYETVDREGEEGERKLFETVDQGSITVTKTLGKHFGVHASGGATDNFFSVTPVEGRTAFLFNSGLNLHGAPFGNYSLLGIDYYRRGNDFGTLVKNSEEALALRGITGFPLTGGNLLLSAEFLNAWTETDPATLRARGEWLGTIWNLRSRFALTASRFNPLFQAVPIERLGGEAQGEYIITNNLSGGLGLSGGALRREGMEETGYDVQAFPFVTDRDIATLRGNFRRASLPTGTDLIEWGGAVETTEDFQPWGLQGLALYARANQSIVDGLPFNNPKKGNIQELGGEYCIAGGEICFGGTIRRESRTGLPLPTGASDRLYGFATVRYQEQPGGREKLSPQTARVLERRGVTPATGYYPAAHYAAPRRLFAPSPIPGGVYPFDAEGGLPQRKDGVLPPEMIEGSGEEYTQFFEWVKEKFPGQENNAANRNNNYPAYWLEKNHLAVAEARENNPSALEQWHKKEHADAAKSMIEAFRPGLCAHHHSQGLGGFYPPDKSVGAVIKSDSSILQHPKTFGTEFQSIQEKLFDKKAAEEGDPGFANPFYSEEESNSSDDYNEPEGFEMAIHVLCQNCHDAPHQKYLALFFGLPGGRHHGADALRQPKVCGSCHVLPGSKVNKDMYGYLETKPHLECDLCHSTRGPFSHAPVKEGEVHGWGPELFGKKDADLRFTSGILGVKNGGRHGKTAREQENERGANNVSCRSCHDPEAFCSSCHSRMNTHGQTETDRFLWGRGGRHKWVAPKLVQGAAWITANREAGTNCDTCHVPEVNCFNCHGSEQTVGYLNHDTQRNRHTAATELGDIDCMSCHKDHMGNQLFHIGNQAAVSCIRCHSKAITGFKRTTSTHPLDWATTRPGQKTKHGETFCERGSIDYCANATCHGTKEQRNQLGYTGPLDCNNSTCHSTPSIPSCRGKGRQP